MIKYEFRYVFFENWHGVFLAKGKTFQAIKIQNQSVKGTSVNQASKITIAGHLKSYTSVSHPSLNCSPPPFYVNMLPLLDYSKPSIYFLVLPLLPLLPLSSFNIKKVGAVRFKFEPVYRSILLYSREIQQKHLIRRK